MGRWGDGEMGRWGDGEMGRWGDGEMGEVFIKRCSAVLGRQRRPVGVPPETKPDYVEPLWLVGYAEKG
ncbi:hypothetical protein [Moorena sp. SIO4G3]|uniref:hypothetical protein n=1 Tax=Moorena sp. SIO4G3 TaxID=2607821 RepID=UPI001428EF1B|nr:hypothetical protein [Moorena sp. SIO4G3]NEO78795.1 hypothetical protein [Moorena sp. SIO4G3]